MESLISTGLVLYLEELSEFSQHYTLIELPSNQMWGKILMSYRPKAGIWTNGSYLLLCLPDTPLGKGRKLKPNDVPVGRLINLLLRAGYCWPFCTEKAMAVPARSRFEAPLIPVEKKYRRYKGRKVEQLICLELVCVDTILKARVVTYSNKSDLEIISLPKYARSKAKGLIFRKPQEFPRHLRPKDGLWCRFQLPNVHNHYPHIILDGSQIGGKAGCLFDTLENTNRALGSAGKLSFRRYDNPQAAELQKEAKPDLRSELASDNPPLHTPVQIISLIKQDPGASSRLLRDMAYRFPSIATLIDAPKRLQPTDDGQGSAIVLLPDRQDDDLAFSSYLALHRQYPGFSFQALTATNLAEALLSKRPDIQARCLGEIIVKDELTRGHTRLLADSRAVYARSPLLHWQRSAQDENHIEYFNGFVEMTIKGQRLDINLVNLKTLPYGPTDPAAFVLRIGEQTMRFFRSDEVLLPDKSRLLREIQQISNLDKIRFQEEWIQAFDNYIAERGADALRRCKVREQLQLLLGAGSAEIYSALNQKSDLARGFNAFLAERYDCRWFISAQGKGGVLQQIQEPVLILDKYENGFKYVIGHFLPPKRTLTTACHIYKVEGGTPEQVIPFLISPLVRTSAASVLPVHAKWLREAVGLLQRRNGWQDVCDDNDDPMWSGYESLDD